MTIYLETNSETSERETWKGRTVRLTAEEVEGTSHSATLTRSHHHVLVSSNYLFLILLRGLER